MKKWTIWLSVIIILAAAGGGAYYYFFMRETEAAVSSPTSQTAKATKGDIKVSISGTGSIAADTRETVVAGKSGTIATLSVKEGDLVKKGQVLATFEETDDFDDQIKSINKNITKIKEQMADKQEDYKAAIGTENEEDTTASIKDDIKDLQSQIDDYQDDLNDIYEEQAKEVKQVVSSIDGEVTVSDLSVGDEVDAKTVVAELVDYTHLEFVTKIDELDIPSLKVGQTAQITLSAITDRTIEATVSEIAREGTTSNGSASYDVSLLLNDIEGVLVGMSGQADITIESKTDVVLVPVDAVIEMGGKSFVRIPSTSGGTAGGAGSAGQGTGAAPQGEAGSGQGTGAAPQGEAGAGQGTGAAPQVEAGSGQGAGAAAQGEAGTAQGERAFGGQRQGGSSSGRGGMANAMGGQMKEVTVGISDETNVEIVSGLEEGDEVLIPTPQGTTGMGTESTEQTMTFPGGGSGFPSGGMGGGMGGGMSGGGMGGGGMR